MAQSQGDSESSICRTVESTEESDRRDIEADFREIHDMADKGGVRVIVHEIHQVLAEHYGFTDEELDFIINGGRTRSHRHQVPHGRAGGGGAMVV